MSTEGGIRFASQTYSWQMSGRWNARLDEICHRVASAGFAGIEPEVVMTDGFRTREALSALLESTGLQLAALTLVLDWIGPTETSDEVAEAGRVIDVVRGFPGSKLVLVQMPRPGKPDRTAAQDNLLACLTSVAQRAADAGVSATFHPNSPPDSIVRDPDDYARFLPMLPRSLGWTPDTGHLAVGGMDPIAMIRDYRELVDHIHFKDVDASHRWVPNGTGVVDMRGVTRLLADTGYTGWIVVEDESPTAEDDPMSAADANGAFVDAQLRPLGRGTA
jgi:inosose dehydratase